MPNEIAPMPYEVRIDWSEPAMTRQGAGEWIVAYIWVPDADAVKA